MGRSIVWDVRIDWDFDGTYTSETSNLVRASGVYRIAAPASSISNPSGMIASMQLVLDNSSGRYSPLNTSGALYSDIASGGAYYAPIYVLVSVDGGSNYYRVFTGVIKTPVEVGATAYEPATVRIDCRGRDELLLNARTSTLQSRFRSSHQEFWTEADIIEQWLIDAGYSDGTDYVVDTGLFVIPWAWLDDESPIEEIWQLAAACGGRFYCDKAGIFRYENAYHWLTSPHDTSQETLNRDDFTRFEPYYADSELYSAVTVEMSSREEGATAILWEASAVETIPADSTKTIVAKLQQPAYTVTDVSFTAVSGGGESLSDYVDEPTLTQYAQRIEMEFENTHTTKEANLLNLSLTGIPIQGRPSNERTYESADAFWTAARQGRTKALRSNVWIQTEAQMEMLGNFLRDRLDAPRLMYKIHGVPGNGNRNLGDRITVQDSTIMTSGRTAFITGITWAGGATGFEQTIEAIDAADLYVYATTYGVVNVATAGTYWKAFY